MYKFRMKKSLNLHNDGIKLLEEMIEKKPIFYYKNGKPYLKNSELYFSVSHSVDMVVCVISDKEIGIDIEKIRQYDVNLNKELNIKATNNVEFFKEYTRKEAYLKKNALTLKDIYTLVPFNVKTKVIDDYVISIAL